MHVTIEELLEAVFSMRPAPKVQNESVFTCNILIDLGTLRLILHWTNGTSPFRESCKMPRCDLRQENYVKIAYRNDRNQGLQDIY
jgi:hypothetical protein